MALSLTSDQAAVQRKSIKQLVVEFSGAHLEDLEKKGLLPKGK
jgi:hypothetical protein